MAHQEHESNAWKPPSWCPRRSLALKGDQRATLTALRAALGDLVLAIRRRGLDAGKAAHTPTPHGEVIVANGLAKRPTRAEHEQRLTEVAELLVRRLGKEQIVRLGRQRWGVGARTMERYLAAARQRLAARAEHDPQLELGRALAAYDLLFAKMLAAGDLRGAAATIDRLVRLLDLTPEQLARRQGRSGVETYLTLMRGPRTAASEGERESEAC